MRMASLKFAVLGVMVIFIAAVFVLSMDSVHGAKTKITGPANVTVSENVTISTVTNYTFDYDPYEDLVKPLPRYTDPWKNFTDHGIPNFGTIANNSGTYFNACTPSMEPTIQCSDTLIIQKRIEVNLSVGDIIIFAPVNFDNVDKFNTMISHRIVGMGQDENGTYYITKGDNNPYPDPGIIRDIHIHYKIVGIRVKEA